MKSPVKLIAANPSVLRGTIVAALLLGVTSPLLAARATDTISTSTPPSATNPAATAQSSQKCLTELRALNKEMQTGGYWLNGYGYGYPNFGYGYGYGYGVHNAFGADGIASTTGHLRTRPGYEIRTLIASGTILARRGQQQTCGTLLTTARDIYETYVTDLRDGKVPRSNSLMWRRRLIASAQPTTDSTTEYRADQLISAEVVNDSGDYLGDVYDVALNPRSAKIAYLVIGRGGVFGFGEKHIPVPWEVFKISDGGNLMVLDTTKDNLDGAPTIEVNHFSPSGRVGLQGQSADAFWKDMLLK